MLTASVTSSVTSFLTSLIGDHGLYAVFVLMLVDAVLPAASELVMVYAGALAAGAFTGQNVVLFGERISAPFWAFFALALAGTLGYVLGSVGGWAIGVYGGRPYLERHGRWLHVDAGKLDRADRWFRRFGSAAVFFGRVTPVVRSFISIPAGIARMPLGRYVVLTFLGSVPWCFGLAGVGWALGAGWERFHHDFRYVDYAALAALVAAATYVLVRRRRSSRLARRVTDPAR